MNKDDPSAASKFQEVQAAYEVLSDDSKRQAFDQFGHEGVDAHEHHTQNGGGSGGGAGPSFEEAQEIFARMFGGSMGGMGMGGMGGGMRGGSSRGMDVQTQVRISFMDAINGCSKRVAAPILCNCETCNGNGTSDGKSPAVCPSCKGSGHVAMQDGLFMVMGRCERCRGAGVIIKNPCRSCGGKGAVRKEKSIDINIPAGIEPEVTLRVPNEGDAGERGRPPGHLYVTVLVSSDPVFQREGSDIHVHTSIPYPLAALGGAITVPTVKGDVELVIPAGTQPGDKLVMRGRGVKKVGSRNTGNQVVHVKVNVPTGLTAKQKQLLEELQKELEGTSGSGRSSTAGASAGGAAGRASYSTASSSEKPSFFKEAAEKLKKVAEKAAGFSADAKSGPGHEGASSGTANSTSGAGTGSSGTGSGTSGSGSSGETKTS